jgi:PAS domain S-box-containing protein
MIKILVIDDNRDNLVVLKALLSEVFPDAHVITATSGVEGVELAHAISPDVIMLDLVMPNMDGIETCKKFKEDRFLKWIPVIMMTAYQNDSKIRTLALESGIEAFLTKPINTAELTAQVSSMIRLKKAENMVLIENERLEEQVRIRTLDLVKELEYRIKLEEALIKSEERYHALFDRSLDCIYIFDFKGRFIDANDAALKLFGLQREKIHSIYFESLLDEDQLPIVSKIMTEIKETGFQKDLTELKLKLGNGNVVYIETLGSAILSQGKYTAIQLVARNITERKKSENELRKLSLAIEQSPVSILITDIYANIIYANQKVYDLTGYSIEDLKGKSTRIFQSGETHNKTYKDLWDTIISGKEWWGEFHNKKKNGDLYWESASISPIFDIEGKLTNFLAVKEDITERKKMIAILEEAKEKAEAGDRLKSTFINNISHEVRTPLNGILGFSSLITQSNLTEDEKEQYHTCIKTSSYRLLNTITNFMDISLIASGNMDVKIKYFYPDLVLELLFEQFKPMCDNLNLDLILSIPDKTKNFKIHSDAELFMKVLTHLLDNAVKFTQKGEITFGYITKSGFLKFFIKDTGTGINSESQNRIFDNFIQEEVSDTRGFEGSGLGLSIARGLIRLLGSEIYLHSDKGVGTTFFFQMPFEI